MVLLAALAMGSGLAFDLGVRGGPANAVVVAGVILAMVAVGVYGNVRRAEARWLMLAALVPAACLALRVSPWLTLSNLAAVAGFTTAAICVSQSGSLVDMTPLRLTHRTLSGLGQVFRPDHGVLRQALRELRPLVPRVPPGAGDRAFRLWLALLITLPVLLVVMALLASADAVFAGLLSPPDVELGPAVGHVVLTLAAASGVVSVTAASRRDTDDTLPPGRFGTLEVATMLGLATAVMSAFAVSQLLALTSAGDRLIEEAGLTPAEYARSGFFQLCWATALIVAFLALVRGLAAPGVLDRRAPRWLGAAVPVLTLGLVAVSLRRMALYDEAFGLTMLRLWVVGAAVWMGLVLVMIAVRNLGLGAGRDWVLGGSAVSAWVLIIGANVVNAEAFVVHHNVDRAADGAELDTDYLARLSDDAFPAYTGAVQNAPAHLRPVLRDDLPCGDEDGRSRSGVAALNLSVASAVDARDGAC